MKFRIKALVCVVMFCFITQTDYAQQKAGHAELKGRLINFSATVILEDFSDVQNMVPSSTNQRFTLGKDSTINIIVPLKTPCYFRLGRNKLYLNPGDNIDFTIDFMEPGSAVFKGKGSVANNYLRNVPFPKSGSFIEAGKYIKSSPSEMLEFILNKAKEKDKILASLKGVSVQFIQLEKARNRADIIKTISAVQAYAGYHFRTEPTTFLDSYLSEFKKISGPVKDSLLKNFVNPDYLQVEVYRDIYDNLDLSSATTAQLQVINDWLKAENLARRKIKPLGDKTKIPELKISADSINTKKYRDILNLLLAEKMKFGAGDPAIDFAITNQDGTSSTLSSLKGKVIYIDIWATWCGPCMVEMPHLEELKEKYKSRTDLAIVSLSVDNNDPIWLKNLEQRKPEGIQWRIDRPKLAAYEVEGIPRFILIDKNFKVVEMDAPIPSDPGLIKILDRLIEK